MNEENSMMAPQPVNAALLGAAARRQSVVSWSFAGLGLALFFGYLSLIAFDVPFLRLSLPGTQSITIAIALGYAMILLTVILTGLFFFVDRQYVQPLLKQLREQAHSVSPTAERD